MRNLWPSIELIRSNWRARNWDSDEQRFNKSISDKLNWQSANSDVGVSAKMQFKFPENELSHLKEMLGIGDSSFQQAEARIEIDTPPPDFLQLKFMQRSQARQQLTVESAKAGQIWRFDDLGNFESPVCVLLNRNEHESVWSGWIAAPETDYATDKDVLLESEDEPFDPLAAMIQTWNPVRVDMVYASRIQAKLTEDRLIAIREVAAGQVEHTASSRPAAPLVTLSGRVILAGRPIQNDKDPRLEYRDIYSYVSQKVNSQF